MIVELNEKSIMVFKVMMSPKAVNDSEGTFFLENRKKGAGK